MLLFLWLVLYSIAASIHGIKEESILQSIMNEITELKTRQNSCDRHAAKITEFEVIVAELQKRNDELEKEILQIRAGMNCSKENVDDESIEYTDDIKNKNRYNRMVAAGQVAFTAGVSTSDLTHLGDHVTIVFDKPITNIGNAYSITTGIFHAPLKGIYVFTLTLMVVARHSEYLQIVVDGNALNDIFADASSVDDNVSTTKQWVLDLSSGSEVWIRTSSYQNMGEIHGTMHTAFSGFLLFETE